MDNTDNKDEKMPLSFYNTPEGIAHVESLYAQFPTGQSPEPEVAEVGDEWTSYKVKHKLPYVPLCHRAGVRQAYLVRGAWLECNYGSHHRRLNLPRTHGVYIGNEAVINAMDCKGGEGSNVPPFGVCSAPDCPHSGGTVLLKAEKKNPLTGELYKDQNGYPLEIDDNVKGYPCAVKIVGPWQNTHSKTLIGLKGEPHYEAVTTASFLVCKYCGIIEPINSGQPLLEPAKMKTETMEETIFLSSASAGVPDAFETVEAVKREPLLSGATAGGTNTTKSGVASDYIDVQDLFASYGYAGQYNPAGGKMSNSNSTLTYSFNLNVPTAFSVLGIGSPNADIVFPAKMMNISIYNSDTKQTFTTALYIGKPTDNDDNRLLVDKIAFEKLMSDAKIVNIDLLINNLQNDATLNLSVAKKQTIVQIGQTLLANGLHPAFVAGMLANIVKEGNVGQFESSAYSDESKKPEYLKIMDTYYNYRKEYSGQNIADNKLSDIYDILKELESKKWEKGYFGLGSIQWTGERTKTLVEIYLEVANKNDIISNEQIIYAESLMFIRELNGNYKFIYTLWQSTNQGILNSNEAAYNAGYEICVSYVKPQNRFQEGTNRGQLAQRIFEAMLN
jgi:hypothetical protein